MKAVILAGGFGTRISEESQFKPNDVRFEFIDLIKYENEKYVVLLPVYDSEEMDKNEVIILKLESADDVEKESYVSVDDEGTLQAVFSIFKEKFKDEFDFTDD